MLFSRQNLTVVNTWANHCMCGKVYAVHVENMVLLYGQVNPHLFCFWKCLEMGREKEILVLNNYKNKEEEDEENTFQQERDEFRCILIDFNFNNKKSKIINYLRIVLVSKIHPVRIKTQSLDYLQTKVILGSAVSLFSLPSKNLSNKAVHKDSC